MCGGTGWFIRTMAIATWICVAAVANAAKPSAELLATLESADESDEIRVIVTYRSLTNMRELALSVRAKARGERRRQIVTQLKRSAAEASVAIQSFAIARGAKNVKLLWASDSVALTGRPHLIRDLLSLPDVIAVRLDAQFSAPVSSTAHLASAEWNISMIGAPELWTRGYHGEGVVVATLDSGVDVEHPDLAVSYRGGTHSWFDPYAEHASPSDVSGHGTQVMGVLVGGDSSGSAIGVAPGAQWIAARIFNNADLAQESAVHLAFQWVLDPDQDPATDDAPAVVSHSWDFSEPNVCHSVFQADIDVLRAADIAVVFSAGNFGPDPATSVSPANGANVLSVGAVDASGAVAPFSSRGPSACSGEIFPRLAAPGDFIYTTDLSFGGLPLYTTAFGTSFAAPHVAGVIALLRGAFPEAPVVRIEEALVVTARDVGAVGPDDESGYGVTNALAAFEWLATPVDTDGDGHTRDTDCNDEDAAVHPGAREILRDGVDQDCNGYDLTLKARRAQYNHDGSRLHLEVVSSFGEQAALELEGVAPLTWRPERQDWVFIGPAGKPKKWVVVSGIEGRIFVPTRMPGEGRE